MSLGGQVYLAPTEEEIDPGTLEVLVLADVGQREILAMEQTAIVLDFDGQEIEIANPAYTKALADIVETDSIICGASAEILELVAARSNAN